MRVRLLTGISGPTMNYSPGDEIELDDAVAQRLIDSNQAERVRKSRAKKPETAAKPKPERASHDLHARDDHVAE